MSFLFSKPPVDPILLRVKPSLFSVAHEILHHLSCVPASVLLGPRLPLPSCVLTVSQPLWLQSPNTALPQSPSLACSLGCKLLTCLGFSLPSCFCSNTIFLAMPSPTTLCKVQVLSDPFLAPFILLCFASLRVVTIQHVNSWVACLSLSLKLKFRKGRDLGSSVPGWDFSNLNKAWYRTSALDSPVDQLHE